MSVSGETEQTLDQAQFYQQNGGQVIAITNQGNSTLAHMADLVIPYYMPERMLDDINLTTQIPVVYILECLAYQVQSVKAAANQDATPKA
ncbi:SIS domain-containing protein [Lactobacillus selangorensis]|uniref:SIS domain-containing protein n=1 Tax=Lactobacillus selangorensis TaxID=81857 RepID=UPI00070BC8F0|nr:SIS domain-containing protein [Lactobacillus selangorensis]